MPDTAKCRGCGADIVWVRTAAGKANPCDPELIVIVTNDGRVERGRVSHFATCPAADQFRGGAAGGVGASHD